MRSLAHLVSGRRGKWFVPLAWIIVAFIFAPVGSGLQDEVEDRFEAFLPESAESTEVVRLLDDRFESGQTVNGLIVYKREGGLTDADQQKIASDAQRAAQDLPLIGEPAVPFREGSASQGLVAPDGQVAYTVFTFDDDFDQLGDNGKELREIAGDGGGGLEVYVTGDAGFTADFEEVFGNLDATLLLATVLLVLVLLGAIYRSPLIAITPLIVVFFAYMVATGLIYLYAKSGATVSSNSTTILVVLMFGVGTDYCLLLVSRYREELRNIEDKHEAMQRAVRRSGPAILASGLTVCLTLLVLLFADTGSINSLGPVAAIGVACVLLASLTLLPAMLTLFGRRGFWPRRSLVEYDPDHVVHERTGIWRRIGDRVLQKPGLALTATILLFAGGALGLLAYEEDYSTTNVFKQDTESVDGFNVLEESLSAGATNPSTVLVERENGPVQNSDLQAAADRVTSVDGIESARATPDRSEDGRIGQVTVIFDGDPYTSEALARVPKIRDALDDMPPGTRALLGGGSAVQFDFAEASESDLRLIVPIALVVITIILAILLQAIVAPLVLVASVVVSFFGTLGLSLLFFRYVVGDPGVDASLPVFAFIFLVALGIDYTIFLMSRVREEARLHGTREGVLRALSATGPVITSAGIILAGTFSVLMTLPVTFAFNIGFMVAVGILLDTFIVRTVMVPAAVELIGDKIWWPSTPEGGAGALHEEVGPEPAQAHVS